VICPKGLRDQWIGKIKEYGITIPTKVLTKEEFRRDYAKLPVVSSIIVDECHHFSNPKSQMHKHLVAYLKRAQPKYVWIGTATPYRSEPFNIWALGRIVNNNTFTWIQFRDQFYHIRYLGQRMIWEKNEDDASRDRLMKFLSTFADIVTLDDCFDMPEQIDLEPEMLKMSKEQEKAIEDARLEESNPLVFVSQQHQIENGSLKGNEFRDDKTFPSAKIERIRELAEDNDKLLIFCRYTLQIEEISRDLASLGYNVETITGANSADHYAISQRAESAEKCIIVAQISVAAGWEVPSFKVVVYASMSYGYLDFIQSRGRVIRGNKLSRHVFYFLHSGPVDKAVYERIKKKKDFDPLLYDNERTN
jgi:superfamily II DNA or RNA helicase